MDNRLGLVILNYMTYFQTIESVDSALRTSQSLYRLYIVDNDSPNESLVILEKHFPPNDGKVVLIKSDRNGGFSYGNNVGLRRALADGCDIVILSNNDIVFELGTIDALADFMEEHPEAGMVGPRILNMDGSLFLESRYFIPIGVREKLFALTKWKRADYGKIYRKVFRPDLPFDRIARVFSVHGCCFALSRAFVDRVGPLDEEVFLFEEEFILGKKLAASGFSAFFIPADVIHKHSQTIRHIGAMQLIHFVESEIYYCRTYLYCSIGEICPLLAWRLCLYLSRCLVDRDYRDKLGMFLSRVRAKLSVPGRKYCLNNVKGSS